MAGIAIVLDLFRRTPPHRTQISASATVSAAAASIAAAAAPFASGFLFSFPRVPIAHCDVGAELPDDYFSRMRRLSGDAFQRHYLKHAAKEYQIQLKPLFSAFQWKQLAITSVRSFLMFYLPLLESPSTVVDDDDDSTEHIPDHHNVDFALLFQKSLRQIIRETTVVTTRRILERLAVSYVSQRMAWKLLKDVPKSAMRKAEREMSGTIYFFRVSRTTFRGNLLGAAASWIVQVGIETYRFCSHATAPQDGGNGTGRTETTKILGRKVAGITIFCGASLLFASIGAGIGAILIRPRVGQWIGCAVGDLAGPVIVMTCLNKVVSPGP